MSKTFIRLRGAVALGMVILIYFMIITGTTLWIAQRGGILPQALWSFASRFHPIGGFTMFILGIVHITLNKKLFKGDLEALFRKEKR